MTPIKNEWVGKTIKRHDNCLFLVDDAFITEEKKVLLSLLDDNSRRTFIGVAAMGSCYEEFNGLKKA